MGITPREVQDLTELSQEQRAVLTGTLLGDGCLARHGRFHRLHVKHKRAHEALAMLKYDAFREFISMAPHYFDQKLRGKRFPCVQFATRTHPIFSEWHSRFYREGRKGIPDDIACDLSPQALAVWLMDDGAADHFGVTLQTHSFRPEEVDRLATVLRAEYRLEPTLRANRGGHIIYVPAASMSRLRELVGPHVIPVLRYKLTPRQSRNPVETIRWAPELAGDMT